MDILRSYRSPKTIARLRMDRSGESTALATLMGAVVLIFVGQWPRLAREAHFDPLVPLDARIGGALFAILFILPLIAYLMSLFLWGVLRVISGPTSARRVRVALFWTLLVIAPAFMAHGFFIGFLGNTAAVDSIGLLVLLAFFWVLFGSLRAASSTEADL